MILYIRSADWQKASQFYEIDYNEATCSLTLNLCTNDETGMKVACTKVTNLKTLFKRNNFYVLRTKSVENKVGFGDFVDMNNITRSRDELYSQQILENTNDYPNVVIYFHNSEGEVLVFVNGEVKTQYLYKIMDNKPAYLIAQDIYPDLITIAKIWEARKDMIWQLDPNQSLAYLEAQLDAMTRALFLLLKELPDVKDKIIQAFPEIANFESELDDTSLFTVKSAAKCLEEISNTKSKVRELQQIYYKTKRDNE